MARAAPDDMHLSIHQSTSAAAGYRGSLDGWARAGIRYVELSDNLLDRFLEHDTLPAARRVLTDRSRRTTRPVQPTCRHSSGRISLNNRHPVR